MPCVGTEHTGPVGGEHPRSRSRERKCGQRRRHLHADPVAQLGERAFLTMGVHDEQVGVAAVLQGAALGGDRHPRQPRDDHRAVRERVDQASHQAHERPAPGEQDDVGPLPLEPRGSLREPDAGDVV